jgi:hypothetical protein
MLQPRAARVAELLKQELGVETRIERGGFGEFTILTDGEVVLRRTTIRLPADSLVVDKVRSHLSSKRE